MSEGTRAQPLHPRQAALSMRMLWGALLASIAVYAALPLLVQSPGGTGVPFLLPALALIAFGQAAASLLMRNSMLLQPLRSGALDPSTSDGAQKIFTASILVWVMVEAIAIYGLVLYMVNGARGACWAFCAAAAALMLVHAPHAMKAGASSAELARPDIKIG